MPQWVSRILVTRSLSHDQAPLLLLPLPRRFDPTALHDVCSSVTLQFYRDDVGAARELLVEVVRSVLMMISHRQAAGGPPAEPPSGRPGLLVMQEESLRTANHLRNQLHFLSRTSQPSFDTFVLKAPRERLFQNDADFAVPGVVVLPFGALARARKRFRHHPRVRAIRNARRTLRRALWKPGGYAGAFFSFRAWVLLSQAELMAAFCLEHGIKLFLTKEPGTTFSDAMQLIADDLGITTVALQYSNLPFVSPVMMSTADTFIVFSNLYRPVFEVEGIGPRRFHINGYLYDGIAGEVAGRAAAQRAELHRRGARFVLCYFDESVQYDRWGLVSRADHLGELHALANAVLRQPDLGLVVKSQYMKNSPSHLYPSDDLLRQALATGRYLEIREGVHRNDVYPTEAALVADLCISHKFGATAGLEAAVAGKRTVLLDTYGTRTLWDGVYARANIVFESIDAALAAIALYRSGDAAQASLGDWTPILHDFDAAPDGQAIARTRQMLEDCLANAAA